MICVIFLIVNQVTVNLKHLLDSLGYDSIAQASGMTDSAGNIDHTEIVLPIKGLNIPFADLALNNGDSVEIDFRN